MKWLVLAARLVLGGTFLYAGIAKIGDGRDFAIALGPFLNLPVGLLGPIAFALTVAEILSGILIIVPRAYPLGAAGVLILALLYAGVISWGVANGIIVDCGCFGREETPSVGKMDFAIVRDLVLAGVALMILIHWKTRGHARRP